MKIILIVFTLASAAFAQDASYKPGVTYQTANPNYPARNPFYFEGRVDWDLLKIDQPSNAWEYAQRGIHKQDDLEDVRGAIDDYRKAMALNSLDNGTCQIVTAAPAGFGQNMNPPPCMFTVRLRLANLLKITNPSDAIGLFQQVLQIDPLRLGVNALLGETYAGLADQAADPDLQQAYRASAVASYQAELALSPVTELSKKLTGDEANNAHVHWALADLYQKNGDLATAAGELDLYLKATKWHSDTYPWRIDLARKRIERLRQQVE
jgi:tetratricopeptide (TPR) repeat protein